MASDTYHHGDLPNALRCAASEVLAEKGVAGFSLREVARRAGVSHAAPAHHFGDAQGLLTSVAVEAMRTLTEQTQAAVDDAPDPIEALVGIGRAYVTVAVEHPGPAAVVFRKDAIDADDEEYLEWGDRAFAVLHGAVRRIAAEHNPDLDVVGASQLCWSMVQGLVDLYASMEGFGHRHGNEVPPIGDLAERSTRLIIAGLAPGC